MRLKTKVLVQAGQDSTFKKKLVYIEEQGAEQITDGYQRASASQFSIDPASIEAMSFGDVTVVKGIYIEATADVLVRLNGSLDSIQLRKASDVDAAKLFLEGDITGVEIENTDPDNPVTGIYACWGDVVTP